MIQALDVLNRPWNSVSQIWPGCGLAMLDLNKIDSFIHISKPPSSLKQNIYRISIIFERLGLCLSVCVLFCFKHASYLEMSAALDLQSLYQV